MKRWQKTLIISVGALIVLILLASVINYAISTKTEFYAVKVDNVEKLVNQERSKNNLPPLKRSEALDRSASDKCNDLSTKNYWSHVSPDNVGPDAVISRYLKYEKAGENLGKEFNTSEELVTSWIKSTSHRDNILDKSFSSVGYATCDSDRIVVQHFTN